MILLRQEIGNHLVRVCTNSRWRWTSRFFVLMWRHACSTLVGNKRPRHIFAHHTFTTHVHNVFSRHALTTPFHDPFTPSLVTSFHPAATKHHQNPTFTLALYHGPLTLVLRFTTISCLGGRLNEGISSRDSRLCG